MNKKILLFGQYGQISWELRRSLSLLGELKIIGSKDCDFRDATAVASAIRLERPSLIVNASAYTNVEKAELEEDLALQINGHAVGVMGSEAKIIGAPIVHYSTDYVFDGKKETPYLETDRANPVNAYGRSKSLGEQLLLQSGAKCFIFRVSWVYGARGANFYKTMLRLALEREELRVVEDQIGAPTWCRMIAEATALVLGSKNFEEKAGVYHMTPAGETSWIGFAAEIFSIYREKNIQPSLILKKLTPIQSEDFPSNALRPKSSRMCSDLLYKNFGVRLPSWQLGLRLMMEDNFI